MMKLLIIDDSPDALEVAKTRLAKENLDILCAEGGIAGLEIARREKPDLILLDLEMPDMCGFDVCRALKADAELCMIPVLFLTGSATAEDKVRGLDLGAVDYVTKPFDAFELCARVRAALRTKHLQDLLIEHAHIDPLTGLPNRRALMERLQREWARIQRHKGRLSCIMADIDHFKRVNDVYGHHMGDKMLQEVAQAIGRQCREMDLPARYGGEEFVVVVPDETAAGAACLAERCRQEVAKVRVVVRNETVTGDGELRRGGCDGPVVARGAASSRPTRLCIWPSVRDATWSGLATAARRDRRRLLRWTPVRRRMLRACHLSPRPRSLESCLNIAREDCFQILPIRRVIGNQPVRRGGFELEPTAVLNVVQGLADLPEIDAPLAEHVAGRLWRATRRSSFASERANFLEDVAALVGRVAHVVVDLHCRRSDAIDDPHVVFGAKVVLHADHDPLFLRLGRHVLEHSHEMVDLRGFAMSRSPGPKQAGMMIVSPRALQTSMLSASHCAARGSLFSGTLFISPIGQRGDRQAGPLGRLRGSVFCTSGRRRCMSLATVPMSICTPSSPICLATSKAAGSHRLPSDQSQAPILNRRDCGAANNGANGEAAAAKAAAWADRTSMATAGILS